MTNSFIKKTPIMIRGFTERRNFALRVYYQGITISDNMREAIFLLSGLFWYGDVTNGIPAYRDDDKKRMQAIRSVLKKNSPELKYCFAPYNGQEYQLFEEVLEEQCTYRRNSMRKAPLNKKIPYDTTYRTVKAGHSHDVIYIQKIKQQKGNRRKALLSQQRILGVLEQYFEKNNTLPSITKLALLAKSGKEQAKSAILLFKQNTLNHMPSTSKDNTNEPSTVLNIEIGVNNKSFYSPFNTSNYLNNKQEYKSNPISSIPAVSATKPKTNGASAVLSIELNPMDFDENVEYLHTKRGYQKLEITLKRWESLQVRYNTYKRHGDDEELQNLLKNHPDLVLTKREYALNWLKMENDKYAEQLFVKLFPEAKCAS